MASPFDTIDMIRSRPTLNSLRTRPKFIAGGGMTGQRNAVDPGVGVVAMIRSLTSGYCDEAHGVDTPVEVEAV